MTRDREASKMTRKRVQKTGDEDLKLDNGSGKVEVAKNTRETLEVLVD